jgi:hypothetical protein
MEKIEKVEDCARLSAIFPIALYDLSSNPVSKASEKKWDCFFPCEKSQIKNIDRLNLALPESL